jgi:hypothetical protein
MAASEEGKVRAIQVLTGTFGRGAVIGRHVEECYRSNAGEGVNPTNRQHGPMK